MRIQLFIYLTVIAFLSCICVLPELNAGDTLLYEQPNEDLKTLMTVESQIERLSGTLSALSLNAQDVEVEDGKLEVKQALQQNIKKLTQLLPSMKKTGLRDDALLLLGEAHEVLGNKDKALEIYQQVINQYPDAVKCLHIWSVAWYPPERASLGNWSDVRPTRKATEKEWQEWVSRVNKSKTSRTSDWARINMLKFFERKNDLEKVKEICEEIMYTFPQQGDEHIKRELRKVKGVKGQQVEEVVLSRLPIWRYRLPLAEAVETLRKLCNKTKDWKTLLELHKFVNKGYSFSLWFIVLGSDEAIKELEEHIQEEEQKK